MRLIDAYKVRCDRDDFDTYADYIKAFDAINEAPTVDAVPVVRCKDCKHHQGHNCDRLYGFQDAFTFLDDDYCSKAEVKHETD